MADEINPDTNNKITENLVSNDTAPPNYTDPGPNIDSLSNNDKEHHIELSPANNNLANDESNEINVANNADTNPNQPPQDEYYTPKAHRFRRIFHVIVFLVSPIIYFWTAQAIADGIGISVSKIISFIILLTIIGEFIRIKKRFIIFGMRDYERDHICAMAWGTISEFIVLLLAFPRTYSIAPVITHDTNGKSTGSEAFACFGQIAIPIIWCLGIGDPLLGELKRFVRNDEMKAYQMYLIADVILTIIWILCFLWCGTPWWLALMIPPFAIIAEKPSIPHIDDNGLMLLVPLLITLIFEPWFKKECDQIFYN